MNIVVDLSEIIAKQRQGPKSSAQTPAKPDERKKGSKMNEPGSAGTTPEAKERAKEALKRKDDKQLVSKAEITFSEKVVNALKEKVKNHNAKYSKKVTLSQLKKVYRRGLGIAALLGRRGCQLLRPQFPRDQPHSSTPTEICEPGRTSPLDKSIRVTLTAANKLPR